MAACYDNNVSDVSVYFYASMLLLTYLIKNSVFAGNLQRDFFLDIATNAYIYRVAQKSKPLSLIIIKSYENPPWLDFSLISTRKWV